MTAFKWQANFSQMSLLVTLYRLQIYQFLAKIHQNFGKNNEKCEKRKEVRQRLTNVYISVTPWRMQNSKKY